jgi:glutamyl-tRNA reductase
VSVFALGLNHTTAPLDLRGRLAFAPEQMAPALQGLRERLQRNVPEAALVSTCNRTELYVAADSQPVARLVRPTVDWLAEQGGISGGQLLDHSYVRKTAPRRATPSAWRRGWIRWCWASRRSWAR